MKLPVALQLYSVRDALEADFAGTLRKVKEMGYDGVELSGLNGRDPVEVRELLAKTGLLCPSAHAPVAELAEEGSFERYAAAGCRYVVIPGIRCGQNNEALDENIETIRAFAKRASAAGVTLLYHNHDFEFQKVNGKAVLDIIYDSIPADLLQTQLDTCWVKFSGNDPVAYLEKYTNRAPLVHLKDYWSGGEEDASPYEIIGVQSSGKKAAAFEFRPVGHGVQDIPAIIAASEKAGAQWLIVEQDESKERPTLEAARMSIDYLRSL